VLTRWRLIPTTRIQAAVTMRKCLAFMADDLRFAVPRPQMRRPRAWRVIRKHRSCDVASGKDPLRDNAIDALSIRAMHDRRQVIHPRNPA
jgi:hypothetical protein